MIKTSLLTSLALCLGGLAPAQTAGTFDYDMCGTIVQGVTCPLLFEDTNGLLWVVDDTGPFGIGDVVRVIGTADPGCISICNQGNGCIFSNTIGACGPIATSYCFCAIGPCGNDDPDAGCANTSGSGATLDATGSASVFADDLAFHGAGMLPGQPALLFCGDDALNGGAGFPFGDGLRCAGNNVVRLGTMTPDANGEASWGPGLAAQGGWSAGDVRRFQAWYRDPAGSGVCGSAFNLSHGSEVTFVP